jgi:hypothetical protein
MNILWALSMVLAFTLGPPQEQVSSEITFCNFDLPKEIKHANASFYVIYSFKLDRQGRPDKIVKAVDDYVGAEKITACLENWRFHGIDKEAHLTMNFRWEHAEGWVEATVAGPDFRQKIKFNGECCPYPRMQSKDSKRP